MEEEKHCRKTRGPHSHFDESFLLCAGIFLPYLTPAELASVSLTCKTLHQIAKTITSRRTSDASRGFENLPIPFLNPITPDSESPPYSYFLYTATQILRVNPDFRQPWGSGNDTRLYNQDHFLFRVEGASGCDCANCGEGGGSRCPCMESEGELLMTLECGPSCNCDSDCGNRVTQGGVSVKLKVVKDKRKGWGLYADDLIPYGQFICEYTGELLSTEEARQREVTYDRLASKGRLTPALLVVKEHLPSGNSCIRINIDATRVGNVARFINHSCDGGNLDTVIVRSSGALLPRVCFFASRDIQEHEELTFSYGDARVRPNGRPCFCGTSSCAGILPSEHT